MQLQANHNLPLQGCIGAFIEGLTPPPDISICEWADSFRVLGPEESSIPGQWDTSKFPLLRGIMDALSPQDRKVRKVVFKKCTQIGGTEILQNALGHTIHIDPAPVMTVYPTSKLGKRYSVGRLESMIRNTPKIGKRIAPARSRDANNTQQMKTFPGGLLIIAGSNSPSELKSQPCKRVFCDEIDEFPADIKSDKDKSQGDPLELVEERTENFLDSKIYMVSTPTIKGVSAIEREYDASDRRKPFVPCPHCGKMIILEFENLQWEKETDADGNTIKHLPETVRYLCDHCGTLFSERHKPGMIEKHEWRATNPEADGTVAGFVINRLYSLRTSWVQVVKKFLAVKDNPLKYKAFKNNWLARTYELKPEIEIDRHGLLERLENFGPEIPDSVKVLTAGIDTQDNRLECLIIGWGESETAWMLRHYVLHGNPSQYQIWSDLDALLSRDYGGFPVLSACIDTGGHKTDMVYQFCMPRYYRRIYGIKGLSSGWGRQIFPSEPHLLGDKNNFPLFSISTETAKEWIYDHLVLPNDAPGCIHIPRELNGREIDIHWINQLTAEELFLEVNRKTGKTKPVWRLRAGKRNEVLDMFVYALAALKSLQLNGLDLSVPLHAETPPQEFSENPSEDDDFSDWHE